MSPGYPFNVGSEVKVKVTGSQNAKTYFRRSSGWREFALYRVPYPLTSTWPHLNSDIGFEEGEYKQNCLCAIVLCSISAMHIAQS